MLEQGPPDIRFASRTAAAKKIIKKIKEDKA
jgi:hypothetical protein